MVVGKRPTLRDIKFRKLFVHAGELGLSKDDLYEIAEFFLRRDLASLNHLDETQLDRMLDGLELAGFVLRLRGD